MSKRLQRHREIAWAAVRQHPSLLRSTPKGLAPKGGTSLRDDRAFVLTHIRGLKLKFVSRRLRDDEQVVLAAVKHEAASLRYASKRLRATLAIALAARGATRWVAAELLAHPRLVAQEPVDVVFTGGRFLVDGSVLDYTVDTTTMDYETDDTEVY